MTTVAPDKRGTETIGKLLLHYSLPAIIGMLVVSAYTIIDRIFVGQIVGPVAMAGVTITFPIGMLIMACGMLVGIGSAANISIRLGQQKPDQAEIILGNAFSLLVIIGLTISLLCLIFLNPLLRIFGATPEVILYAKQFLLILLPGSIFQFLSFGLNQSITAQGNPRIAMMTMLISALLNILFCTLFVYALRWGVRGSALATVLAQLSASVWVLTHLRGPKSRLKLRIANMKLRREYVQRILMIGLAPFTLQFGASFVALFVNKTLGHYGGDMAIGAMGAIFSISFMMIVPIIGISQGAQPIIGFNYGARQPQRIRRALQLSVMAACIHGLIVWVLIQMIPHLLMMMFSHDTTLISIGTHGIRRYLLTLPLVGYLVVGANFFLAIGKPMHSMALNLSRQVLVLIPLILILPHYWGIDGVWFAMPLSDLVALAPTTLLIWQEFKSFDRWPSGASTPITGTHP